MKQDVRLDRGEYRVLVVDDHGPTRYAIARGLRACGFRTFEAATGAEGLELARSASAVVLDVNLPDVHGHEVCRLLRQRPESRSLPIVHVSAISLNATDRMLALALGANGYLAAPVDPVELADTLDGLLCPRGSRQPGRRSGSGADAVLKLMSAGEKVRSSGMGP